LLRQLLLPSSSAAIKTCPLGSRVALCRTHAGHFEAAQGVMTFAVDRGLDVARWAPLQQHVNLLQLT